ncbi:hypothetical protein FOS14_03190 [Skermania sp. ID1734]|uniref:hypothetical protein n=1 Tax=Skermania sp. ID1734 TaxID=2597516 RepID=UPI0011804EE1|nr:hypothetical protein [Skermania sp. ID1734]TSE01557.1 hypothetical protein FOS14_03190 [Skermania sp. ID1734]
MNAEVEPGTPFERIALVLNAQGEKGRALTLALVGQGYRVVLTARHTRDLAPLLVGLSARQAYAVAVDIASGWQVQRLHEIIRSRCGAAVVMVVDASAAPLPVASAAA